MTKTANEYAEALFGLCLEEGSEDATVKKVEAVLTVFTENPGYGEMLASPVIAESEKLNMVEKAFGCLSSESLIKLLKLMCRNGKGREISDMCRGFIALYMERKKETRAVITSASELSKEQKEKLCQKLEKMSGFKIFPEFVTDSSLIGGLTVSINGRLYDGSLKARLEELKEVTEK